MNLKLVPTLLIVSLTTLAPEGVVNETCEGTSISQSLEYYVNRKRPSDDPHGRGPVMLAK